MSALSLLPAANAQTALSVPSPNASAWKASKKSAAQLAKAADAKLSGLKGVSMTFRTAVTLPSGRGTSTGELKIRDGKTFRAEYPRISYKERSELAKILIVSDGTKATIFDFDAKTASKPVSQLKLNSATSPADWNLGHARYLTGALLGEKPLSSLVALASKANSGFKVDVLERTVPSQGRSVPQQQLRVTRTPAAAKNLGPLQILVTIDEIRGLPVTVRTIADIKGRGKSEILHSLRWDLRPNQKFPEGTFVAGKDIKKAN